MFTRRALLFQKSSVNNYISYEYADSTLSQYSTLKNAENYKKKSLTK